MKVLNFGSINIDHTYQVDHFVRSGETLSANAVVTHAGGKGYNQSIALARAGAQVFHAGCIGSDGAFLVPTLIQAGVDTQFIRAVDTVTGNAIIQVEPSGSNCILLYPGANEAVTPDFVDEVLTHFGPEDVLLVQNEISCLDYLTQQAARKSMRIAFNPSPINSQITDAVLSRAHWILLNETEASAISGVSQYEEALSILHRRFQACIVLTMGAQGVLYLDQTCRLSHDIYPVKAVDTTGAGDTFTGFFLGSLIRGYGADRALEFASKAAALSVTQEGAAQSIPSWEAVLAFL